MHIVELKEGRDNLKSPNAFMHLLKTVGRITRKDKLTVKTRAKFSQKWQ